MSTTCNFKTAEASTKAWFRTKNLLDEYLNIPEGSLQKFREANTKWSVYANETFNVPGRLFAEERNGKKALPNIEMFRKIDIAKGKVYPENEYLRTPSESISQPVENVKEGVSELFESNPELYEASGVKSKPDVILPIGTSGSGKSTFIKSLPQENLVVIEPDAMRVEFTGNMNDKSKDKEIYIEAANRVIAAIRGKETPSQVYSKLGNKTKTPNIVIQSVYQKTGVEYAKSIGGIFSLRVNGTNNQFGNPFSNIESEIQKGLIRTKSTRESVEKYIEWVLSPTTTIKPEQHKFIREWLQSGKLKGKPIVYYKELGEPSHATALDYLINKYDWVEEPKQVVFDTTNLTKDKRLPFIEAVKKAIPDANIQYKLMELNPELAKKRIKAQLERGESRAVVSDETIDRHAASYKQMLEDIKNEPISNFELTPQQKQQAQQLYSQYLDTIFPNSKVKNIVYRGMEKEDSKLFQYFTKNPVEAYMYAKAHITKGGQITERNPIRVIKNNIAKKYNLSENILFAITDRELGIERLEYEGLISTEDATTAKNLLKTNKDIQNFSRLIDLYNIVKIESEEDLMKQFDDVNYIENIDEYNRIRKSLDKFFNIEDIGKITSAVINIENPYVEEIAQEDLQNDRDAYKNGHDGAFLMDGDHFVIKNNTQVFKLGSNQDIEGFKKFTTTQPQAQQLYEQEEGVYLTDEEFYKEDTVVDNAIEPLSEINGEDISSWSNNKTTLQGTITDAELQRLKNNNNFC